MKNIKKDWACKLVVNSFYSTWRLVRGEVLQGLGPCLFNLFINYLETEWSPIKFADDTETEGAVQKFEGPLAFQNKTRQSSKYVLNSVVILLWTGHPKVLSSLNDSGIPMAFSPKDVDYNSIKGNQQCHELFTVLCSCFSGWFRMRPSAWKTDTY